MPLQPKSKEKMDRLQAAGVIVPITEPIKWCAPMVPVVKKSGKLKRNSIDECFESIFNELQISRHTQINVGCNREPNNSVGKFNETLSYILGNLTSKMVYFCGDFNIELLYCEEQTESKYCFAQMFSSGLYPLITRPTRITATTATIIDNICSVLSFAETKYAALF